jgi:uncharacterized protein YigA (DUF484 family)
MDIDRRRNENSALRERLDALLADGQRNEQILSRHRRIELGLLEGSTFPELFDTLFNALKGTNDYDVVTLALCDPDHELRRLFGAAGIDPKDYPDLILLGGLSELYRVFEGEGGTSLGAFVQPLHGLLFPREPQPPQSVAILPLQRRPNLLPVLEKQSAILSRALSICGDDVTLIDRYMAVAEQRFDADATIALWSSVSTITRETIIDSVVTQVFRCAGA